MKEIRREGVSAAALLNLHTYVQLLSDGNDRDFDVLFQHCNVCLFVLLLLSFCNQK